jgi:hypothetical protein
VIHSISGRVVYHSVNRAINNEFEQVKAQVAVNGDGKY